MLAPFWSQVSWSRLILGLPGPVSAVAPVPFCGEARGAHACVHAGAAGAAASEAHVGVAVV